MSKPPQKMKSKPPNASAYENPKRRVSPDITALVDTIRDEGRAYRDEEEREDRGAEFREYMALGLLFISIYGLYRQVDEMVKVYKPIKTSAQATEQQTTAFINASGPYVSVDVGGSGLFYMNDAGSVDAILPNGGKISSPELPTTTLISISVRNDGKTPTRMISERIGRQISKLPPEMPSFEDRILDSRVLGADKTFTQNFGQLNLSNLQIKSIASSESELWLYGCVKHYGLLEDVWEEGFLLKWTVNKDGTAAFTAVSDGPLYYPPRISRPDSYCSK